MRMRYPSLQNNLVDGYGPDHAVRPGRWRAGRHMEDCRVVVGATRDTREGKKQRNTIRHWVNSAGAVDWQDRMI